MEAESQKEPIYLPVSAVAEILYCPRNFYYRVIEGAEDSNAHLLEGRLQEEKRERRGSVTRDSIKQARSIEITSEHLKLIGVVDCLEERDGYYYPVEYKKGTMKESLSDDVQLCAQAMMLEEKLSCCSEKGYIYYAGSRSRREVYFQEDLRVLVENTVRKALDIIESGIIPPPAADGRCNGCALESRCLPMETNFLQGSGKKPSRPVPAINLGRILYVDEPGSRVKKKGLRLVVEKEDRVLTELPLCNIDQVVLVGGVNLSTPAMKTLLDYGIDVVYLTINGNYRGIVQPPASRNCLVRLAQFNCYFDQDKRIALARCFVTGKLSNMRALLLRYNRKLQVKLIESSIRSIGLSIVAANNAGSLEQLLGVEGMAAREYFRAFSMLLKTECNFQFNHRNRRPPRDPVNALLSFAYTLLAKDMHSAIQVTGLDPYIGFLHQPVYGRPALALDLMEEFRPVVADSAVLSAINRGSIGKEDFSYGLGGCFLKDQGRKKFYKCYEERRRQEITHPVFDYRLSYLRIFELQARFWGKVLQGELDKYISVMVR